MGTPSTTEPEFVVGPRALILDGEGSLTRSAAAPGQPVYATDFQGGRAKLIELEAKGLVVRVSGAA